MKHRRPPLLQDDEYRSFEWARKYVHQLNIENRRQWKQYCNSGEKPGYIPAEPDVIYAEWINWSDWFGKVEYLDFPTARAFMHKLCFTTIQGWEAYRVSDEKPSFIPSTPGAVYKHEWQGIEDWLGLPVSSSFKREYLPFEDAKNIVRKYRLKNSKQWEEHCRLQKKHSRIPVEPDKVYVEWKGWRDWLGVEVPASSEQRSRLHAVEEALLQLHESQNLTSGQIMIVMRHAGILSKWACLHALKRIYTDNGIQSDEVKNQIAALEAAIEEENESLPATTIDDLPEIEEERNVPLSIEALPHPDNEATTHWDVESSATLLPRDREIETKELRGWSAVGNLLDPSPALIQLCVTRLKTAFYRFANELRGNLDVGAQSDLESLIWDAAFSEYGTLIKENELLQASCQQYTEDLAAALRLPRSEQTKTPRLYQLDGARFLAERLQSPDRPYALLFDEPGMGKTLTTLWALAAAHQERFVIVVPLTVKSQVWTLTDLQTAFPHLQDKQVARSLPDALKLPSAGPAVAILHYAELRKIELIQCLITPRPDNSLPFDAIIFDEAHTVKVRFENKSAESAQQRQGAELLRQGARACIGLTATPLVNELYEPISLLQLARQEKSIKLSLHSRKIRDRVDVMEYLLKDTMRRQKAQVLSEIPPRQITSINITPTSEQMQQIEGFLKKGRRIVGTQLPEYRRYMMDVKLEWIKGRVEGRLNTDMQDRRRDSKLLILCYNVDGISQTLYKRLVDSFGASHIAYVDGTVGDKERDDIFARFREAEQGYPDDLTVLIGTVGTVGTGITLFDARSKAITPHRIIFADLPYTWAEFEQGVDRLHRIGQRYPVEIEIPLVSYGEQLTSAEGERIASFDEWVWEIISRKQVLSDQVLDASFDISEYQASVVHSAIREALQHLEQEGGPRVAPAPPEESEQSKHRHQVARYRAWSRKRVAEMFLEPGTSHQFLAINDASPAAKLAQTLVRERLAQWLDRRSVVVDLGCGSNPLRDLDCTKVIGVDRHGVNGGLIGDSAETGLPTQEADFVVFSLSMWGTPQDRLAYLQEAKRLLRPIGKLVIVEPMRTFGEVHSWKAGVAKLEVVLRQLGMELSSVSEHLVDSGARLVALVVANSTRQPIVPIDPQLCIYTM